MHSGSPFDPLSLKDKEKPIYTYYIIRQGKAKLQTSKLTSVFHHLPSVTPKQLCALAHLGCTCTGGTYEYSTKEENTFDNDLTCSSENFEAVLNLIKQKDLLE